ncbi:ATP-binding protein [Streptomyces sp. NPDC005438]|uniref:ATP-binding protein n=1 Tax=Streptomyces sp. NPDC005438 TaxID=3156880 RepID=UPI0033A96942
MQEYGNDGDGTRVPDAAEAPAAPSRVIAGEYRVTLNPIDGSEIEPCPPAELPPAPARLGPGRRLLPAEPPVLLEREEPRRQARELLGSGCSIRLRGAPGAGRTALLDAVTRDVAGLAPDGVIHLGARHRTLDDLRHHLFASVYQSAGVRPGPARLSRGLAEIGAVVVLDDLALEPSELERLFEATPECAYLFTPEPGSALDEARLPSHIRDLELTGLSQNGALSLLAQILGRDLDPAEERWAREQWRHREGSPVALRQAGGLLIRWQGSGETPTVEGGYAAAVAAGLSAHAQWALLYALALDGVLPDPSQLPALVGDPQAGSALDELVHYGLVTRSGGYYRLATGVGEQLTQAGFAPREEAATAAAHYDWWITSVPPERVLPEAEALIGAVNGSVRAGQPMAGARLARTAAPALATGAVWGDWERLLRAGQEAARACGQVGSEAYFHHERGVLALCDGGLARARAELEASINLRGVLSDRNGAISGRRALALVDDLQGVPATPDTSGTPQVTSTGPSATVPPRDGKPPGLLGPAASGPAAASPGGAPSTDPPVTAPLASDSGGHTTVLGQTSERRGHSPSAARKGRPAGASSRRRNVAAAGAGALLALALGTVFTMNTLAGGDEDRGPERVTSEESDEPAQEEEDLPVDPPLEDSAPASKKPSKSPSDSASPSTSAPEDNRPSRPTRPPGSKPPGSSKPPSSSKPPPSSDKPTNPPTSDKPTDPPTSEEPTDPPTSEDPGGTESSSLPPGDSTSPRPSGSGQQG